MPAPSPLSLPPSSSRMTLSSVIIIPSSTTSSLSSVVVPSSAQIPDEQVSASVRPSLDVDVVDGALTSQKHVTFTFTSPVPSSCEVTSDQYSTNCIADTLSASSRKPVVTSHSKPSTTSADSGSNHIENQLDVTSSHVCDIGFILGGERSSGRLERRDRD